MVNITKSKLLTGGNSCIHLWQDDNCILYVSIALLNQKSEGKQPNRKMGKSLADKWIRKLWYIYTMEYYSAIKKNSFESVLMRWMKLESIIQSEVSQKDKHEYSILTHIYGI